MFLRFTELSIFSQCGHFPAIFATSGYRVLRIALIGQARWRRSQSTEAIASRHASASGARYRLAEDVGILAIVVAELELGEIQRQILLADVVVRADDSALEQRPEAFNVVVRASTAHVFMPLVIDSLVRKCLIELLIARALHRSRPNRLSPKPSGGRNATWWPSKCLR